jgi:hypothetical protein
MPQPSHAYQPRVLLVSKLRQFKKKYIALERNGPLSIALLHYLGLLMLPSKAAKSTSRGEGAERLPFWGGQTHSEETICEDLFKNMLIIVVLKHNQ